jgi:hypothetical protein
LEAEFPYPLTLRNVGLAAWHVMWHFVISKRQKQIMDIRDGMETISLCSFLKEQAVFSSKIFPQSCDLSVSAEQVIRSIKCASEDVKEAESFNFFIDYIKQLKTTEGNITIPMYV